VTPLKLLPDSSTAVPVTIPVDGEVTNTVKAIEESTTPDAFNEML
jgi:hypothetical protein